MASEPDAIPGVLLVEVGGSAIRVALMGSDGPLNQSKTELDGERAHLRSMVEVLDTVAACGIEIAEVPPRRAVVAWPGPVTPEGAVLASPTVSGGVDAVDVVAELAARWDGAEIHVVNDLTAAGIHLCTMGLRDFAIITVGSGIGHKVFQQGQPVVGPHGRGGELGHLVVETSELAPMCDCGGRGHLGAVASGRAIVQAVREMWIRIGRQPSSTEIGGPDVVAALRDGEPAVVELVGERARALGWALASLHTGVGVETYVLVGGFAVAAGEAFRREVARGAAASCWNLGLDWDRAVTVGPDVDAPGLVGAWLMAREKGWR